MKGFVALAALLVILVLALFVLTRVFGLLRRIWRRRSTIRHGGETTNHEEIADAADDVAGAGRVAATIATWAALIAAPAGFMALLATVGIVATPLIVTLLPFILGFAGAAAAISALAKLYAKRQRKIAASSKQRPHGSN